MANELSNGTFILHIDKSMQPFVMKRTKSIILFILQDWYFGKVIQSQKLNDVCGVDCLFSFVLLSFKFRNIYNNLKIYHVMF